MGMVIRARAPMRISFAGGGTDVPPFPEREGGCVLNATVNKYVYGTLRPRDDAEIRVESLDLGMVMNCNPRTQPVYDGKLDLVKAAISRLVGQDSPGFDLYLYSEVPPGTGLGSSSSVAVTLVGLLKEMLNMPLTNYEIANLAFMIERRELGIEGGWQDQYAAAFGGFNFIEFGAEGAVVNPLRVDDACVAELEANLLLCYTGHTHLSDGIIKDQTRRYEEGNEASLRGLRRQKELAVEMKNALLQRRIADVGRLLHEAWEAKKSFAAKVTLPAIDELYELARRTGAVGGKITGAGGGGFMLLYCPFERRTQLAQVLTRAGATVTPFAFESRGLQTWRIHAE